MLRIPAAQLKREILDKSKTEPTSCASRPERAWRNSGGILTGNAPESPRTLFLLTRHEGQSIALAPTKTCDRFQDFKTVVGQFLSAFGGSRWSQGIGSCRPNSSCQ